MKRVLILLALLATGAAAGKTKAPKRGIEWAPSWEDAVEAARALNVPILVHRHGFY